MKGNIFKGLLLLAVIVAGITTAWLLRSKPVGQHDKAAMLMLDKLYHPKYRIHAADKVDISFDSSSKTDHGLYALKNIKFHNPVLKNRLQIGEFKVIRLDQNNEFPNFFTIKITALKITRDTLPGGLLYLPFLQLRLKQVLADGTMTFDYKPSAKTLSIALKIKFRKLFKVNYQLTLNNFSQELLVMVYAAEKREFIKLEHHVDNTRLVFSSVKITNTGFIQRVFKAMSPAMTETLNQSLSRQLTLAPNALMKQGTQALIDFIRHKKSIFVSFSPNTPMSIKEFALANNQQKRKLLNAVIKAEK